MTAKFVYLDSYYYTKRSKKNGYEFKEIWKSIEADLIEMFGEPSDPRDEFTARWTTSLMMTGDKCPRGVYFKFTDDLLAFKLKYPEAEIRQSRPICPQP